MNLRFYTNAVSQASRRLAVGLFLAGLLLVGFGLLVYVLRDLFAILASIVFFIAGASCGITAVKILLAQRKLNETGCDDSAVHRENVRIHIEEHTTIDS